jgi:hypothetical protein
MGGRYGRLGSLLPVVHEGVEMSITPTFAGEMQLAGWSESHTGGCKVTFWLQSPDELQAFRTLTTRKGNTAGHRFMAALVEIGDDEQPVHPIAANPGFSAISKPKMGPMCQWVVQRCNEVEFLAWIAPIYHSFIGDVDRSDFASGADFCRHAVMVLCECDESRKEIDTDAHKAALFHARIRGPYSKHLAARGVI